MSEDFIEVPVTRRARVVLVGRVSRVMASYYALICDRPPQLDEGDQVVVRIGPSAPFRTGVGRVVGAGIDLTGIPTACDGDLLYRVEPA